MSIHTSLKIAGKMAGERNVWTRMERLAVLKKQGLWKDGESVVHLPKVRTHFKVKSKKQIKAEASGPAAAAPAPGAAAPAAPAAKDAKGKEAKGKDTKGGKAKDKK